MSQLLADVNLHVVYSTKRRCPCLLPEVRPELYAYSCGILRNLDCVSIKAGGIQDHIHLLFKLPRTRTISDVVKEVKAGSSKWLKSRGMYDFAWQAGYGAFSISYREIPEVASYIARQPEHHRTESFKEEFLSMLEEFGVPFDERYLWDE